MASTGNDAAGVRRDLKKYVTGVKGARAELLAATHRLSDWDRPSSSSGLQKTALYPLSMVAGSLSYFDTVLSLATSEASTLAVTPRQRWRTRQ